MGDIQGVEEEKLGKCASYLLVLLTSEERKALTGGSLRNFEGGYRGKEGILALERRKRLLSILRRQRGVKAFRKFHLKSKEGGNYEGKNRPDKGENQGETRKKKVYVHSLTDPRVQTRGECAFRGNL